MPWTAEEAPKFKKGLSNNSRLKWSQIANSVLARTGDEAQAVRIANSRTGAIQRRLAKGR